MVRMIAVILGCSLSFCSLAWNAMGHQLVAQIAYDYLTPKARHLCNQYNRALNPAYRTGGFVKAATWMDYIRTKDNYWFDALHYINIPFSKDKTPLPPIQNTNAIWAINQAKAVLLSDKATMADKGLAFRILIHVVGDLHQPLHAASLVSQKLPQGDRGGGLFPLGKNRIGTNLHQYWDNGAGVYQGKHTKKNLETKAHQLEKQWPCDLANGQKKPKQWAEESHQLALAHAYTIAPGAIPDKQYQSDAQKLVQKRVAFAGCRLAWLLNKVTARG